MKIDKTKSALLTYLNTSSLVRWALLGVVTAVFGVILYPNIVVTPPVYELGDVAGRDIKAPSDFLVEDRNATEEKRQQAAASVLTVYDYNSSLPVKIRQNIRQAFQQVRPVFDEADATSRHERVWALQPEFEAALGIPVSDGAYTILEKQQFSPEIGEAIARILSEILEQGVVANKEVLLRESGRGITLRTVGTNAEQTVWNLDRFYGLDKARTMVRMVDRPLLNGLSYTLANLVIDLSQRLIQPNITLNRRETEERKKNALAEVKPTFYKIKAGEMLLREGERVTDLQLLKLKALRLRNRAEKSYARGGGALMMILILLLTTYFLHVRQERKAVLRNNKDVLFIVTILMLFFFLPGVCEILFKSINLSGPLSPVDTAMFFGIPLAAGAMTVSLFMGFELAVLFSVVIGAGTALIFQGRFEIFVYFFLSSIMGAYWMRHCRERKVFVSAGLKLACLNILLATAVDIYIGDFSGRKLAWDWAFAVMGGIGAGIITAGIVPLLELAFGYTTDITLLELSNLERPILRRLMMEAPGTYHHSIVVGSMVEAAAAEIGANPILGRVCGYYHDIGKIKKPLYFIENQSNCENRHDHLAPSMSGLILISHVKEGVEIARQHKLGPEIIDAIRQHHGTSLIRYFYEKAKKLKGEDAVKIDDYRYPGPRPQNREVGLVMLADVVEAASRTLENPTPSRIQGLVHSLITKIFTDGQLDNCELTLKDLHKIEASFNKILYGIHHHRVEYPESPQNEKDRSGKEKHGRTDHPAAGKTRDFPRLHSKDRTDNIRRIGVS